MAELELVGLHPDGEHVVLVAPDGQRHRLAVTDALRAAVRHDRPRLEQVRISGDLRPRDIQTRIRAGEAAEDIAHGAGVPVESVRRYEGPVLAEQAWVAEQARAMTLGHGSGAPTLGDLVVDRLAAREVPPEDLAWSAARRPGEGWELVLRFRAGGRDREARWSVDIGARTLHALDDESRWLSETDLGRDGRRHLARVERFDPLPDSHVYDVEVDVRTADVSAIEVREPAPATDADSRTVDLLEGLHASRGLRREAAVLDEEPGDGWGDPPPAHPAASAPHERPDASVLPLRTAASRDEARAEEPGADREAAAPAGAAGASRPASAPAPANPTSATAAASEGEPQDAAPATGKDLSRRPKGRSRRTSVPSWDEIVFGAKPD